MMLRGTIHLLRLAIVAVLFLVIGACSLLNREGPDVSCTDLHYGAANACSDGIIATCVDGAVRYKVCDDKSACEGSWQSAGAYRCEQSEPAPVLTASPPGSDGGGTSPGSDGGAPLDATNGLDGSSTTCPPPADETCGAGQGRRYCTDSQTWTDCLVENANCVESKSGGWPSFADTAGGACSGKASGVVVACKACEGAVVCGEQINACARPAGATTTGCGKPGTVVREPNTPSGETYCLQNGAYMNRDTGSGTLITSGDAIFCGAAGKPGDDVEPCSGPGSAEVCESCSGVTWVRVCRTTGKWSGCNRGRL